MLSEVLTVKINTTTPTPLGGGPAAPTRPCTPPTHNPSATYFGGYEADCIGATEGVGTTVRGSWVVPRVNCDKSNLFGQTFFTSQTNAAVWAALGGENPKPSPQDPYTGALEQIGTESVCRPWINDRRISYATVARSPGANYFGVFEDLVTDGEKNGEPVTVAGHEPQFLPPDAYRVDANDQMDAAVTYLGDGRYCLYLHNASKNWSYPRNGQACDERSGVADQWAWESAFWILERGGYRDWSLGRLDWPVKFADANTQSGPLVNGLAIYPWQLSSEPNASEPNASILATTGPIGDHGGFEISGPIVPADLPAGPLPLVRNQVGVSFYTQRAGVATLTIASRHYRARKRVRRGENVVAITVGRRFRPGRHELTLTLRSGRKRTTIRRAVAVVRVTKPGRPGR